jgi:DNA-binding response OmpR family regulator
VTKILVVDDDARFRQLVGVALPRHSVLEAERVSAAETILARERPDLMLVDRLLPDADGAAWMAQRGPALNVPFIFASAFWNGVGQPHSDAKAAGFLRKPASAHAIAAEVDRVLAMTAAGPDAAAPADDFERLRAQYSSELRTRLATIRQALERLRRTPRDAASFAAARRLVHDLAGTAGAFGYDELSAIGKKLEEALVAWQSWDGALAAWAPVVAGARALADWEDRIWTPGALPKAQAIGGRIETHQVAPRSNNARAMAASTGGEKK